MLREACQKKSAELGSLAQIGREGSKQNPNLFANKFGPKIYGEGGLKVIVMNPKFKFVQFF